MFEIDWLTWLVRTLLAGSALLLLAWLALRFIGHPAQRQRLAAWTFRGAVLAAILGLFPAWLTIPLAPHEPPPIAVTHREPPLPTIVEAAPLMNAFPAEVAVEGEWVFEAAPAMVLAIDEEPAAPAHVAEPLPAAASTSYRSWLIGAYVTVAGLAALQLLLAFLALLRLRRSSKPVSEKLLALVQELAAPLRVKPQVRLSTRIASPVCFGWWRPIVLLPQSLADTAEEDELRWVLAHEFDHLHRGDPRTGLWVGVARIVYFAVPWFWAVRRELRLAQEYLADAAAAAGRPADYAAFLVSLSAAPSRRGVPLGAVAVRAGKTDLYRRVSMLTQGKTPGRVSRVWSLCTAGGVLTAAVALSGLGIADDKKPVKEIEVIIVNDDDDAPKPRDGEKKKDAEKRDGEKKKEGVRDAVQGSKPPDAARTFEYRIMNSEESQKLLKTAMEALEKGNVDAAKEAMAKLNKVYASQPNGVVGMTMKLDGGLAPRIAPAMPPQPPLPAMAPGAAKLRVRMVDDESVKKMEEKMESLEKAMLSMKDNPEVREALEKTIVEFKKQIEEARKGGALRLAQIPGGTFRVDGVLNNGRDPFVPGMPFDENARARYAEAQAQMAKAQADMARQMAQLQSRLAELKDTPDDMKKRKELFEKMMESQRPAAANPASAIPVYPAYNFAFVPRIGNPAEARLGITVEPMSMVVRDQLSIPEGQGVVVMSMTAGSPADQCGLKLSDVLLSIDGQAVSSKLPEALKIINELKTGRAFEVVVIRKGKKETIKDVIIPAPKKNKGSASEKPEGDGIKFSSMQVQVNNDAFTIEAKSKEIAITIRGEMVNGKPVPNSIKGVMDGEEFNAGSVERISKSQLAAVEQLLKSVGGHRETRP